MARAHDWRVVAHEYFVKLFEIIMESIGEEVDEKTAREKMQEIEAKVLVDIDKLSYPQDRIFEITQIMSQAAGEVFGFDLAKPPHEKRH